MARKEVNVFGASFLDLLSGALGAIIILYIIVPKLSAEQSDILEQVEMLNAELTEINDILEEFRQSVPEALYEELMARFADMEQRINDLYERVSELEETLRETRAENEALQAELAACREESQRLAREVNELRESMERENSEMERMESELRAARELLAKTFLVIYIQWPTAADVDLHVTDPAGAEFSYQNKIIAGRPGELSEDVVNGPGAEVWEVRVADPGNYHVEANLYSGDGNINHPVRGRIFFRDGSEPITDVALRGVGTRRTLLRFNVDTEGNVNFM
jgi:regulator of replication initiation timing